jgi:hypothetical protein
MSKLTFLILSLLLFSHSAFGRAPAVEPVMGLSIEEIDHVHPDNAVPFDFSQSDRASRSPAIEIPTVYDFQATSRNSSSFDGEATIPYTLIALMLLLPAVIWFGMMKNLDTEFEAQKSDPGTIDLKAARQKRAEREAADRDDLPKAS